MDTAASRNREMEALTERATFAAVLVTLVRQRCVETNANRTSRTGLQLRVPVHERPAVRRGFDALIDHGILAMVGEDIGITAQGRVFVAYCRRLRGEKLQGHDDVNDSDQLRRQLEAIQTDRRFDPDHAIEEASTLPGRLEALQQQTKAKRHSPLVWIILAIIIALLGVALLVRLPH
ncbi:hypothetical protein SAMN05444747_106279 [Variovorax sp. OV329]|nr:hypothetical protein SAMN05444747_106279 [Variovorax sp. OV329]